MARTYLGDEIVLKLRYDTGRHDRKMKEWESTRTPFLFSRWFSKMLAHNSIFYSFNCGNRLFCSNDTKGWWNVCRRWSILCNLVSNFINFINQRLFFADFCRNYAREYLPGQCVSTKIVDSYSLVKRTYESFGSRGHTSVIHKKVCV